MAPNTSLYVFKEVSSDIKDIERNRRLKLLQVDGRGNLLQSGRISDQIDIWAYTVQGGEALDMYGKYTFPDSQIRGHVYVTPSGSPIQVQNLALTDLMKKREKSKIKSQLDCSSIAASLQGQPLIHSQ